MLGFLTPAIRHLIQKVGVVLPLAGEDPPEAARATPAGNCEECEFRSEYRRLLNEVGQWKGLYLRTKEREAALKQEVAELDAKLRLRERQLFAKKTEKARGGNGKRSEKVEGESGAKPRGRGQQPGSEGHGRRLHENLPGEEEVVDFPEGTPICPCCGEPCLEFEETEDSEVLEVEVKAHRRIYRRKRYRPGCKCGWHAGIITAPCPSKLIPKGAYGVSFWAAALVSKFLFQFPTSRFLKQLQVSTGLGVSQGTVTDGFKRLAPLFEPLLEGLVEENLSERHWHVDETRWMVFVEVEGKDGYRWQLWVFRTEKTVVFLIAPSRSSAVPIEYFGKVAEGIVSADRYSAYKKLAKLGRLLIAFCWAHVRRDFIGLGKDWSHLKEWSEKWVLRIGTLYHLNEQRLALEQGSAEYTSADVELRQAVDEMAAQRDRELTDPKLHAACRKVLKSLDNHWEGLTLFLDRPWIPMDNNRAEQELRNGVVGRKNYYGSGAVWSAALTAMLMSLLRTAELWGLNPLTWLTAYLEACAQNGGSAPPDVSRFLPWNMSEEERQLLSAPPGHGELRSSTGTESPQGARRRHAILRPGFQ